MRFPGRCPPLGAALLFLALLAASGALQEDDDEDDAPAGAEQEADDDTAARRFAVPENRTASDSYADALRHLAQRRYALALPRLQRLLDAYENRVARVPLPDPTESLYSGLGHEVSAILRDLEPQARRVYRELYDREAARLLERALERKSPEAVLEVVRRFRHTSAGAAAVEALGDLHLERGDAPAAVHFYRELAAAADPDERARLDPLKLIHALARAGRYEEAVSAGRRLVADRGRPTIMLHGREQSVDALVRDWSQSPLPPPRESWPAFGGGAAHGRLMPALRTVSRLEWQAQLRVLCDVDHELGFGETPAPFHPVVGRGKLYVHNGLKVWALELSDGLERWTFPGAAPRSTDRPGARAVLSGALVGNRFIANLEVPVDTPEHYYHAIPIQKRIPHRKLFAFDSDTGALLWSHQAGQLPDEMDRTDREFLARVSIPSPPVARDDTIYCGASHFEGKVYCYLAAFDVRTGRPRWHRLISTGQETLNMFGRPVEEPVLGVPAVDDGVVYFTTNLGVVAAVDAQLGRIRWLATYPQAPRPGQVMIVEPVPPPGWQLCPTLLKDGVVVAAPTDSQYLLGLDAGTGRLLWTHRRESGALVLRYVLGIRDGVVFASGNGLVALDLRTGREAWPPLHFPPDEQTSWRGAVTAEGVLVPTTKQLRLHDLRTGALLVDPPARWESPNDQAGNVVASSEEVLITTSRLLAGRTAYVSVFYSRQERIRRLEQLAAAHPDDPAVYVDLARTLAQAGRSEEADLAFDRAARAARRSGDRRADPLLEEAVRGRFEIRVRLARAAIDAERYDAAADLVQRARAAAVGQPFQLEALRLEETLLQRRNDVARLADLYAEMKRTAGPCRHDFGDWGELPVGLYARLQAAEVHRILGRPASAVDELEEILVTDPHTLLPTTRGPAGDHAAERIGRLIDRYGRSIYARHDEAADALYRQGEEQHDPERFLEAIARYPNARVTDRCRLAYALAARARGAPEQALLVLRRLFRPPMPGIGGEAAAAERRTLEAAALVALIECYRDLGLAETARELTDRLVADHGDTVVVEAGWRTTARAWAEARRAPAAAARTFAPDVEAGLPLRVWSRPIPPAEHLEVIEQTAPVRERALLLAALIHRQTQQSRLVAFSTSTPPGELWQAELPAAPSRAADRPATVVDGRVVLALDDCLLALDAASGARRWRRDFPERRLIGVAVGEGLAAAVSVGPAGPGGPARLRTAILETFDLATGERVWQQPLQGDYPARPAVQGRRALVTTRKSPAEIAAFDLLSGELVGRLRLSEQFLAIDPAPLAADAMLVSPDSRAALWLVDTAQLRTRWQDALDGAEVDALCAGPEGALVVGLAAPPRAPDDEEPDLALRQCLVFVAPDRPGAAWRVDLDAGATVDGAHVLADGAAWLIPVRKRTGRVELLALDGHGRPRFKPAPLFHERVFETSLFRVLGGVLAFGFDPTARERRDRPAAWFTLIDAERGAVVKRWAENEPAPPRGRGIWPTRTGYFLAWPDRIEYHDLGTGNVR
ncbi:MAG: PQQ-binding-like beta-propeller repeat protein [Planctomycetes bacterium]|nr:PQQ-binding-like beta-propeller repeat protein [Planctomycetota bacterium]